MGYLSQDALARLGFKYIGHNVKISDKASIYNCDRISLGDHTRIDDFCVVSGTVTMGRNVHMAVYSHVAGGEPGVELNDFAGLAYGCHVIAQSDDYSGATLTNPTVQARYKREIKAKTVIGRHVILGALTVVLPGVVVAEGCSVGAHSLVTTSTKPWHMYVGIPARPLRPRSQDLLALEALYLDSEKDV